MLDMLDSGPASLRFASRSPRPPRGPGIASRGSGPDLQGRFGSPDLLARTSGDVLGVSSPRWFPAPSRPAEASKRSKRPPQAQLLCIKAASAVVKATVQPLVSSLGKRRNKQFDKGPTLNPKPIAIGPQLLRALSFGMAAIQFSSTGRLLTH